MTTTSATKPSPGEEARLLESREFLPGRRRQTWHAPRLARSVQPGQFLHLLEPRARGLLLPVLPVAGFDRVAGSITLLPEAGGPAERLVHLEPDATAVLEGPLGRGFAIDPRSRYLLVVADGVGFAHVRAVVDEAVASGRQVTALLGAPTVGEVFPSSLLPDQVEYVVATADGSLGHRGSVADVVPEYEAWADQCFAAAEPPLMATLATQARGRDGRMGVASLGRRRGRRPHPGAEEVRRKSWLQVALPHAAGCALAVCSGCVADGLSGPLRVCREGPAFAAAELRWESTR